MNAPTAGDLWRLREQLERDATATLGRVLVAFSSLDAHAGLMVASVLRTSGKEHLLTSVDEMSLNKRLRFLDEYVQNASELHPQGRSEMTAWITAAHKVRAQRNQMVHGRWDIDPERQKILNLFSLPASSTDWLAEYTLSELQAVVDTIQSMNVALGKLRARWALP